MPWFSASKNSHSKLCLLTKMCSSVSWRSYVYLIRFPFAG
jgi:hypothetical protein